MTNEIVVTVKADGQAPWIVVHADPQDIDRAIDFVTGDLIAKVHGLNEIFSGSKAVTAVTPPVAQSAPPAQQDDDIPPWERQQPAQTHEQPWESPQPAQHTGTPPQPAAPSSGASVTPNGVRIWMGKNPKPGKENYDVVFYQAPYIPNPALREAFNKDMKDGAWAEVADRTTKPWTWMAKKGNAQPSLEQFVREVFARYAAQGAFN